MSLFLHPNSFAQACFYETDGKISFVNASFCTLFNKDKEFFLGKTKEQFFTTEVVQENWQLRLRTKSNIDSSVVCEAFIRPGFFQEKETRAYLLNSNATQSDFAAHFLLLSEITSTLSGSEFYAQICSAFSRTFGTKYAFIAKAVGPNKDKMSTLALVIDGKLAQNMEYDLRDTPCFNVHGASTCFYPSGIVSLFPKDHLLVEMGAESYFGVPIYSPTKNALGVLVVIDNKPMAKLPYLEQIMAVFANRVGMEIEREMYAEELLETNRKLKLRNELLQQYAYVTSHNLRSPIANVLGLSMQLAQSQDPIQEKIVDYIQKSARSLETTVNEMQQILEIQDRVDQSKASIDLPAVFEEVVRSFSYEDNNSSFILHKDWQVPSFVGIKTFVRSIFYNLLSNSIKYSEPTKRLEISVSSGLNKEGRFTIRYSDNGIGFDMEKVKDKIFKPYQRFTDFGSGKGLGLHLIKTQTEAMNGEVLIDSIPNVGTTFTFIFY